jgi:NAD(P)H-dependent FMN reductase
MTLLHDPSSRQGPLDDTVVVVTATPGRLTSAWADEAAADVASSTALGVVLHLVDADPDLDADADAGPSPLDPPELAAVEQFLSTAAQHGLRTVVVAVDEDVRRRLVAVGVVDRSPILYWLDDAIAVAGAGPGWR